MSDVSGGAGRLDFSAMDLELLGHLLPADGAERVGPGARPRPARIPLSFAQELLWLLDRANPGLTAYNMPIARRIRGVLDDALLERALGIIVARHETLRTRFAAVDGEPSQVIDPPAPPSVRVIDLRGLSAATRDEAAAAVVRERARAPFDLGAEHPFRVTLIRLADDDAVLLVETHHIVFDGWSAGVFFAELSTAYDALRRSDVPLLEPLPFQFADHAIWQREELAGERLAELLAYWRAQLGEAPEPLGLPTDFARPQVASYAGARRRIVIDAPTVAAIRSLAQQHDATLYMTLLAAYMTVLHRYTGRETILVGSGVAARGDSDTEKLIGYFNNTLVMRGDFAGDPRFGELLGRVRESCLGAYDHQDVPLEKLVLELRQGDDRTSAAPLFEVVFTMQNTIATASSIGEARLEPFGADLGATKFDVTLLATERDGELALVVQYRTDLFTPATIDRFLAHIAAVLHAAVADPRRRVSEIDLLDAGERSRLRRWGCGPAMSDVDATLLQRIALHASRVGDRPALVDDVTVTTYAALECESTRLARHLRSLGVRPGAHVGLALDRSVDAVVAAIAILKAGAAYVPLPAKLPASALASRIDASAMAFVVAEVAEQFPSGVVVVRPRADAEAIAAHSADLLDAAPSSDALAYVLYTSGSTGVPKGVGVTHANVLHYTRAISRVLADVPEPSSGDGLAALDGWHFGLVSSLGADLGNTCLFPALAAGGTLHIADEVTATNAERLGAFMSAHPFDVMKITPSHLRALRAASGESLLPRRWLVLGGESLGVGFAEELLAAPGPSCRVLNHYGPTETTVGATTFEVTSESIAAVRGAGATSIPVGRPLAGTRVDVLDANARPLPLGVPGELYIGGRGLAAGYVGRPDLTAERFVVLGDGSHAYRTGDRVRWLGDTGTLEFLGRLDDQVKVRGYRVELGEIEHALAAHPGVAECAVTLRATSDTADPVLVGYVVLREAAGYAAAHREVVFPDDVHAWIAERVPPYMVPSTLMRVERIPRTASGKVDRRALPSPSATSAAAEALIAPRTATETAIAAIWCEVLRRDAIGVTQSFVELGGHSLLAIRVLGKLSKQFGVRLPLRTLFDAPTVEQLSRIVDDEQATARNAIAPISARARDAHRISMTSGPSEGSSPGSRGLQS